MLVIPSVSEGPGGRGGTKLARRAAARPGPSLTLGMTRLAQRVEPGIAIRSGWKIDIWAVTAPEAERLMQYEEHLGRALTPELRTIILENKAGVHSHPGYSRTFSPRDVYAGELAGSVRSFADFKAYLAARGSSWCTPVENESPDRRR